MSRTGFEIELLAPRGLSRLNLAQALGTRIVHGFKSLSLEVDDQGDWLGSCELLPAYEVDDQFRLVDDFSIHAELDKSAGPRGEAWRLVFDEARLALLGETRVHSTDPEQLLQQTVELFAARLEVSEVNPRLRTLYDRAGHLVAVVAPYGEERERVCEVVTRPLLDEERLAVLRRLFQECQKLAFTAPLEGSVHVHFDGHPWRNSESLCNLILAWSQDRHGILAELQPNPGTPEWRGAFPESVVAVASQGSKLPFPVLCQQLARAGVCKRADLNLLGLIRPRHRQHTLEARIFPVLVDAQELLRRVMIFEQFLAGTIEGRAAPDLD